MDTNTTIFDEEAAAEYLGGEDNPLSDRTMQRWRQDGSGPIYIKLGRLIRYRQTDLDHFLDSNACSSTSMAAASQFSHTNEEVEDV